jgi:protein-disulfide isomerase
MLGRRSKAITGVLFAVWLVALFRPSGPGLRSLSELSARAQAAYLVNFRWGSLVSGSLAYEVVEQGRDIVVFADYGCRFCSQAETVIDSLRARRPSVRVGYRHVGRSAESKLAAVAAVCAGQLNAFSLVHRALYHLGASTSDSSFRDQLTAYVASRMSPSMLSALERCVDDPDQGVRERLRRDSVLAARVRLRVTPTFFGKNGTIIGVPKLEALEAVVGLHRR